MKFIFLMDPLHSVIFEKDTTFILMWGAHKRGHEVYYLSKGGMTLTNGKLKFYLSRVIPQLVKEKPFVEKETVVLSADQIDCVFVRTDPPFDEEYLVNTWLLDHLPASVFVMNSPAGIRNTNEKIWAARFPSLLPPTLIGRRKEDLIGFFKEHKNIVAKPTDGHGGKAVFHIHPEDRNVNVILEMLTHNWKKDILLQKYISEAQKGDKRILLLNGEPLGAVLRLHSEDDHRNNFFSGGKPKPATINKRDLEIVKALKPYLVAQGLYFVGIDILGDYLTEVNVTSPTCLQEMNAFSKKNLELKVIEFVENCVAKAKSANKISKSVAKRES